MALLIPIRGSDEVVEVKYTELPDDPTDVIDILKAEMATLDLWLEFAVAYHKQGKTEPFKQILQEASDPVVEDVFADAKKERITILDTMASYYTTLAAKQKEKSKRDEYFTQATTLFNKADKIELREELTWVGKAVLLLCRGDPHASDMFDSVLKANPNSIPAYLGKARIHFNNGQYEEALKCYKTVLTLNPNCQASVRLGLGLCYSKLNKPNAAKKAFERVLQLEPTNVEALVGLAIIELNTEGTKAVVKAMTLLKTAYDINPNNSMVLNHLANHFFYKNDEKRAYDLALQAYHGTEVEKARAESCYHMARTFHSKGDFESAFQYYFQAIHHWEDFPLAQYGIGQMYIHKKEYEKAISAFEKVLTAYPENYETLRMLGSLYAQTNRKPKAYQYFKKVTELQPADVEAWIELAQLVENNYQQALDAYEKAQQILEAKQEPIPAELWNNIGTMKYMMNQYEDALQCFQQAIAVRGNQVTDFKREDISIIYNVARTSEMLHDYNRAKELYIGILKVHPSYTDCYMRLGSMAKKQGLMYEANEWYKDTFMVTDKNPDVWAMMANLHLSKDEWLPAQRKFEKILHEMEKDDTYSLLSLGNIYYNAKASGAEKKEREEKYLRLAYDFYWKVLQMDNSNIYAANGVAICCAERGKLNEAKDFFVQVREATADFPDVWVNLANVYLVQGQHVNAIKMYQKCLKKFHFNKDVTVLMLLARAYFVAGRMEECKQTIVKAIHIQPENKAFWFNLALAQEQFATEILRREKKTSADVKKALNNLQQALVTLKNLQQNPGTSSKGPQIGNKAEKHATYCQTALDLGTKALARTEMKERMDLEQKRKMREDAEQALNRKAKEEEARLQQAILEKQREEMEALAFQQKVESLIKPAIRDLPKEREEEEAQTKKKRRKKREEDNFIVEDEPEGAENGEEVIQQMRERSGRAKALQELAQKARERQSDDKDDKRRKRRNRDEGEEDQGEERREKRKKKEKKHKKDKREKKHKKEKKHRRHRDEEEEEEEEEEENAEEGNGEGKEGEANENEESAERKRIKKKVAEDDDNLDNLFASDDDKKKKVEEPQEDKMQVEQPREEAGNPFEDLPKTPE